MLNINNKSLCESCFAEINSDLCPVCGFSKNSYSPDPAILKCGTILQKRYIIGKVIGKGGFGITYRAYDAKLEIILAVKEYYPYGLASRAPGQDFLTVSEKKDEDIFKLGAEKFYGEARLVAKFNGNPNIVAVHDFFYENDTAYYVMEYLNGQTLHGHVTENGVISVPQAAFIASEISNALMAAHSSNILHRDISPDNIMLCSDGGVKLLDFGAARQIISEKSSNLSVILKQGFAPIEQYQRKGKQGSWTDIYSLGATLYYALTGNIPDDPMSRQEDDSEIEGNIYNIDGEFWNILEKTLKIRHADRYQDIFELKKDLNAISVKPEPIITPPEPVEVPFIHTAKSYSSSAEMPVTVPASQEKAAMPVTVPASQEKAGMPPTMPASQEKAGMPPTMPASEDTMPLTVPMPREKGAAHDMPLTVPMPRGNSLTTEMPSVSPYGNEKEKKGKGLKYVIPAVLITVVVCIVGFNIFSNNDDISQQTVTESYGDETEETAVTTTTAVTEEQPPKTDDRNPPSQAETSVPEAHVVSETGDRNPPSQTEPSAPEAHVVSETGDRTPPSQTEPSAPAVTAPPPPETSAQKTTTAAPAVTAPPPQETSAKKTTTVAPAVTTATPKTTTTAKTTAAPVVTNPPPKTTTTAKTTAAENIPKEVKIGDKMYDPNTTTILLLEEGEFTNSDIKNLKYMTNLTDLYIWKNNISDLSPISNLTNLKELYIHNNNISDLSPLSNLKNLKKLSLGGNNISDISPLSKLTNLEYLTLRKNNISDISSLSKLTNLKELILKDNKISDISTLSKLTNLENLDLESNTVSDISPLSKLTNLTTLNLWSNNISDISTLSKLTNLETLELRLNSIPDISPLSNLTKLKKINISAYGNRSRIKDVDELKKYLSSQ